MSTPTNLYSVVALFMSSPTTYYCEKYRDADNLRAVLLSIGYKPEQVSIYNPDGSLHRIN